MTKWFACLEMAIQKTGWKLEQGSIRICSIRKSPRLVEGSNPQRSNWITWELGRTTRNTNMTWMWCPSLWVRISNPTMCLTRTLKLWTFINSFAFCSKFLRDFTVDLGREFRISWHSPVWPISEVAYIFALLYLL